MVRSRLMIGLNQILFWYVLLEQIMNLAIVSPYPPEITGIGQYGYHVSRSLAQSEQFSRIAVLAGSRATSPNKVLPSTMTVDYVWKPDHLGIGRAILADLQRLNPDLVWFNLGASVFGRSPLANLIGYMSLLLVQLSGLPTVVTLHELVELTDLKTLNAPGGRLAIIGARLLTQIVSRADVVCLTIQRYVSWFSTHKPNLACVHIPIGAYYNPECLQDATSPELLFFSTLAPYKGLEVLLSAYLSLLPWQPNLRLTIAGTEHPRFPGYAESMREKYAHLPGVRWLGKVPEEQIRPLFEQAQIVILPYLASTGSSSVILQAGMWGRALVASDIPEIRLLSKENGLDVNFFTNRDPVSLAEAIKFLIASPVSRKAQIEHNFNALQHLRPEATCRAYLQAFNIALEARQSPKRINIPSQFPSELA